MSYFLIYAPYHLSTFDSTRLGNLVLWTFEEDEEGKVSGTKTVYILPPPFMYLSHKYTYPLPYSPYKPLKLGSVLVVFPWPHQETKSEITGNVRYGRKLSDETTGTEMKDGETRNFERSNFGLTSSFYNKLFLPVTLLR